MAVCLSDSFVSHVKYERQCLNDHFPTFFRQALLLLQGGIDVNGRNENGETPLIYLSKALNRRENKKMRQKFAKMLLDMGANPNIQDFRGTTPLMMASIKGQEDLVQTFLADVS